MATKESAVHECPGCQRTRCQCSADADDDAGYLVRVAERLRHRSGLSFKTRIHKLRRAANDLERMAKDLESEERAATR